MAVGFINKFLFLASHLFQTEISFLESQLYQKILIQFNECIHKCCLHLDLWFLSMIWCLYFTYFFLEINEAHILSSFNKLLSYPMGSYEIQFLCKNIRNSVHWLKIKWLEDCWNNLILLSIARLCIIYDIWYNILQERITHNSFHLFFLQSILIKCLTNNKL